MLQESLVNKFAYGEKLNADVPALNNGAKIFAEKFHTCEAGISVWLRSLLASPSVPLNDKLRYYRAFTTPIFAIAEINRSSANFIRSLFQNC